MNDKTYLATTIVSTLFMRIMVLFAYQQKEETRLTRLQSEQASRPKLVLRLEHVGPYLIQHRRQGGQTTTIISANAHVKEPRGVDKIIELDAVVGKSIEPGRHIVVDGNWWLHGGFANLFLMSRSVEEMYATPRQAGPGQER